MLIFFNDLGEQAQNELRSQIADRLLSDKINDFEQEWETLFADNKNTDEYVEEDDYIDKRKEEYIGSEEQQIAIRIYINKYDMGWEVEL